MDKMLSIPNHIAIIMDGNGRWAKGKNRPRVFGHKAGADTLRKIVKYCGNIGVTQSWSRYFKKNCKILWKYWGKISYSLCFFNRELEKISRGSKCFDDTF